MIHHRVQTVLPVLNEPVGFDLFEGDWVAPHGKGKRADVFFRGEKSFEGKLAHQDRKDYRTTLEISFPHELDGIQGFLGPENLALASQLIVPHVAPVEGYQDRLELLASRRPDGKDLNYRDDRQMYIFRVRTQTDEDGEIVQANYGFIHRYIGTDAFVFETMWLSFEYYLNPDPSPEARSLEPASLSARE